MGWELPGWAHSLGHYLCVTPFRSLPCSFPPGDTGYFLQSVAFWLLMDESPPGGLSQRLLPLRCVEQNLGFDFCFRQRVLGSEVLVTCRKNLRSGLGTQHVQAMKEGVPVWEVKLYRGQMFTVGAMVIFLNPCFPTLGGGLQESFVLARMALSSCVPFSDLQTVTCPLLGVSGKPEPLLSGHCLGLETCLILCQLIMTLSVL